MRVQPSFLFSNLLKCQPNRSRKYIHIGSFRSTFIASSTIIQYQCRKLCTLWVVRQKCMDIQVRRLVDGHEKHPLKNYVHI